MKRAYAPVIVSLVEKEDKTEVWVSSDTRESFAASLTYGSNPSTASILICVPWMWRCRRRRPK